MSGEDHAEIEYRKSIATALEIVTNSLEYLSGQVKCLLDVADKMSKIDDILIYRIEALEKKNG